MKTLTPEERARRRVERYAKRKASLLKVMKMDVAQLRKIVRKKVAVA